MKQRIRLHITGTVQGVGFRPFVYTLARRYALTGSVYNDPFGVTVEAQGEKSALSHFIKDIKEKKPSASSIQNLVKKTIAVAGENDFVITESMRDKDKFVFISKDLGTCCDCRRELFDANNRRFLYPFINCTQCGPRYTIIENIPYDRDKTTMRAFTMCKRCGDEYTRLDNRRFHAQPNACYECGPGITLTDKRDNHFRKITVSRMKDILGKTARLLSEGFLLAIKGIGGYHIACDARNQKTIKQLRKKKNRPTKPFALMFSDTDAVRQYCYVNTQEADLLESPKHPILILKIKNTEPWMEGIAPNHEFLGCMLPYAPLHYLIFNFLRNYIETPVLVMTSANQSGAPLVKDESEIFRLSGIVDSFLIHNRPISMRCDDSIVRIYNNKEYIVRKARGYIPDFFPFKSTHQILACGAELKSTFSLTKNNWLISSPYIGDANEYRNFLFFKETLEHFKNIFGVAPTVAAYDYHPQYRATQYALSLKGVTKIPIQHHHAHAASCMVENNVSEKVIGVVFDGVGFGMDNAVWGGEFLVCDLTSFKRAGAFSYFGLVGKDKAITEPYRVTLYMLWGLFKEKLFSKDIAFCKHLNRNAARILIQLIKNKNYIESSSVGRLFDAVAALLGIKQTVTYEAEAAIALEMCAHRFKGKKVNMQPYTITIEKKKKGYRIQWKPFMYDIIQDLEASRETSYIAYRFHLSLAHAIVKMCALIRKEYGLKSVVLSGGVFANWLLLHSTQRLLRKEAFTVYTHSRFPCNDGCISVGQAAIANALLKEKR